MYDGLLPTDHSWGLGLLEENMWPLCLDSSSTLSKPVICQGKRAVPRVQSGGRGPAPRQTFSSQRRGPNIRDKQQGRTTAGQPDEGRQGPAYVLEEDADVRVSLGVDGGLKYWHKNILQHLAKVRKEILSSKHITRGKNEDTLRGQEDC